ncbi:carbohydrate esterase family 1 protein [Jaapia argillacea MUCL 33604]|uniref:Carboxylic ester hydrolase n=1 Tax=Jaapia argillacea MUCL 33604 TaxID=933084 RepID=A0A067PPW5_9AGAM|nr:carbohydrate esterase family 1 protein [Jaapia argillacea MUCL 33604]
MKISAVAVLTGLVAFARTVVGATLTSAAIPPVPTSQLAQVTDYFGPNPTNAGFYMYIPHTVAEFPSLIVAVHYCTGSAQAYYNGTTYAQLSETYGFIVIYPSAPTPGGCWDVASNATLHHDEGGDSLGIASMLRYTQALYGIPRERTFYTGTSSGAMMANVFSGAYPDLISVAVAYAGVPYACFAGPNAWNTQCALGEVIKTPQEWGDLVRSAYPGYFGPRPKMILWHGTADTTLYPPNFYEEIKQWTNVFGLSPTPWTTFNNTPAAPYTQTTYGMEVVGYLGTGVGHTPPVHETLDLQYFGIMPW